ncbi:hypothetical protein N2152v2_000385 [Parachlorella kessleri]
MLRRWRSLATQQSAHQTVEQQQRPLPSSYRRLVARRTGDTFRDVAEMEEAPLPTPGEAEVLVRVLYAGVNGGCETFRCRGEYAFARNKGLPFFPLGAEGAGEVVAVGEGVTNLAVGQHVTFVGGGFSEYVIAKAAACWPIKEATPEAVALTISGTVAATALHAVAGLQRGESLLVTAAAGATGHFAVQLGLLAGCHVVATCGGPKKAARLRELGVHRVIDYTEEDVGLVLRSEYPQGVNVIYEGVGGPLQRTAYASLAPAGRMLQVGYISEYPHALGATSSSGSRRRAGAQDSTVQRDSNAGVDGSGDQRQAHQYQEPSQGAETLPPPETAALDAPGPTLARGASTPDELPPNAELFWKGLVVEGQSGRTVFGQVWPKDRADTLRCKALVFDLHAAGQLQAWVDRTAGFEGVESIPDAVEYMLSGCCVGKVVVRL